MKTPIRFLLLFVLPVAAAGCLSENHELRLPPDATPPAVVELTATPVTGSAAAYISWTAPGDDDDSGRATEYQLRYSTEPITPENFLTSTRDAGPHFAPRDAGMIQGILLDTLQELTTYYFALRTSDEVPNWSGLSNMARVTTRYDSLPPNPIFSLDIVNRSRESAVLSWVTPSDPGSPGEQPRSYEIRYFTEIFNIFNWDGGTPYPEAHPPKVPGERDSVEVRGLKANTRYYFGIQSVDGHGNHSFLSNVVFGRTDE